MGNGFIVIHGPSDSVPPLTTSQRITTGFEDKKMEENTCIYCEECGKITDLSKGVIYTVHLNGLSFELCKQCTDNVRHNADFIEVGGV